MGCCASAPKAETFLATGQPAPAEGYVIDGMPDLVRMDRWSILHDSNRYHLPTPGMGANSGLGGMLSSAYSVGIAVGDYEGDIELNTQTAVGPQGVGKREALRVNGADEKTLATLIMPPHMSFGIPALVKDAADKTVAIMATNETGRPVGMSASSYSIYVAKPKVAGQAAVQVADEAGAMQAFYLWATVRRAPFTNVVKIFSEAGQRIGKSYLYLGTGAKFKYETADGVGLMLSLPVQGEKPATRARHEIQVAPGVDIVLSLCVMYAHKLASDELVKAPAAPV